MAGGKVHQKGGPGLVTEGSLTQGVKWQLHKEKKFWERWVTEKYGGVKAMMGNQVGGQIPQKGPDVLKYIKQHDAQNSSGAIKKALDITQKLQDAATKPKELMSSIIPLQQILGGGLYGAMVSAGAAAKAQDKTQTAKEEVPLNDQLDELIAAAMKCAGEDAAEAAELLDTTEIARIDAALDSGSTYAPANILMPQKFVDCINSLIPMFFAIQQGATV